MSIIGNTQPIAPTAIIIPNGEDALPVVSGGLIISGSSLVFFPYGGTQPVTIS